MIFHVSVWLKKQKTAYVLRNISSIWSEQPIINELLAWGISTWCLVLAIKILKKTMKIFFMVGFSYLKILILCTYFLK